MPRYVHIFNSQELHYCSPNCLPLVAGQSVALPPFCVITVIQEQNVRATFDRRNFYSVYANHKRGKLALIVLHRNQ